MLSEFLAAVTLWLNFEEKVLDWMVGICVTRHTQTPTLYGIRGILQRYTMREFVILQHNKNRLKRWVLIIGSVATTWIVSNYIELTYFAALAPTGIIIVASVIHHIYNEDYKEVGSFCFTEEGILIKNFEDNSENQLGLNDLKKVIYCYAGYYGEEQPWITRLENDNKFW